MVEISGSTYWLISNRAGDSSYYLFGATANAACPDGNILQIIHIFFTYFGPDHLNLESKFSTKLFRHFF